MLRKKGSLICGSIHLVCGLMLLAGQSGLHAQELQPPQENPQALDPERHNQLGKPPTFGEFFPSFRLLCEQVAGDGQGEAFYEVLSSLDRTPNCISCKNFFRGFATSCRVKLLGARKPTPTPVPDDEEDVTPDGASEGALDSPSPEATPKVKTVEKLPPFETIDLASDLGRELFEMQRYAYFIEESLQVLHTRLQQPGVSAYLRVVGDYLTAPFEHIGGKQKPAASTMHGAAIVPG